jgi:glutathione S-transferase
MIEVSAFRWVPEQARGYVKDFRVRWALEEAGLPYRVILVSMADTAEPAYRRRQPFGQIPLYRDEIVDLFESGAILLHLAAKSEALAPRDPVGWARTTAWVFAALNSVEPIAFWVMDLGREPAMSEAEEARQTRAHERLKVRLDGLEAWLEGRTWLEGNRFTVGDLMMCSVLRELLDENLLTAHPGVEAYTRRGLARPGFRKALADQLADFTDTA